MLINTKRYSQKKAYVQGTHRSRSPRETLEDYGKWMEPMGITRLANITGLDDIGLTVYVAIRPNSRALATSQGKGEDADSAKASALMESIESWHGERIDHPLRYESYMAMRENRRVVDPYQLPLRADASLRDHVPLLWIEGWDLLGREPLWLPFEVSSTNFVLPPGYRPIFLQSTNGLASGNHLLEAVSHALCELIERDATTLFSLLSEERRKERQLDLSTIGDPACRRLLDKVEGAGVKTVAWDITSDIGIPTMEVAIMDHFDRVRWRVMPSFSGYGTHLSPEVAFLRALTEAIQSRSTVISGSRDDMFPRDYAQHSNEDDLRRMHELYAEPSLAYDPVRPPISAFFEEDIQTQLDRLTKAGIDRVLVVDLTKEEIGIPVVKMVVPGLETVRSSGYRPGKRAQALLERVSR